MKKTLLSMLALAIAATAIAVQPSVSLSSGKLSVTPQVHQSEGFSAFPMEGLTKSDSSAARVAKSQTRADVQSLDFTLAFNPYTALQFNNTSVGTKIYQAFEMSEANRQMYAGKTITSINVAAPVNTGLSSETEWVNDVTSVVVFLTHDLNGESFYTQNGELGTVGFEINKIQLDEPYVIEADKPLYIGYIAKMVSAKDYNVVIDGVPRESLDGGYCAVVKGSAKPTWQNVAQDYGNLCIGATIEGEGLPQNGVSMYGIDLPGYVEPGKPFSFDIGFVGAAANDAESVEIEYTIGSQAAETLTIPFEEKNYLGFNQVAIYTVSDLVCNEQGAQVPFSVKITKVNGQPNISADNSASGSLQCFDKSLGFTHRYVVEEGTGNWCGYCPAGIVMMEYLKENYPEQFIRVAVHGSTQGAKDPMAVNSTSSVLGLFQGFPGGFVDRTYDTKLGYSGVDINGELTKYYEATKDIPSVGDIDLTVEVQEGAKKVTIPTKVKFALDIANDDRYRVAYYITENNVGPYNQTNYYANNAMGEMGGWENKPSPVSMMYEDVARDLAGTASGFSGSLPTTLKAGETYEYSGTASLTKVAGDEFNVVAMLIDSKTLAIVNAKQAKGYKSSGVESVADDASAVKVLGGNGAVSIEGAYANASVYSVSGQLVATACGEATVEAPAGIYVVVVDGVAAKVVVK